MALVTLYTVDYGEADIFALCVVPKQAEVAKKHSSTREILIVTAMHLVVPVILAHDVDFAAAVRKIIPGRSLVLLDLSFEGVELAWRHLRCLNLHYRLFVTKMILEEVDMLEEWLEELVELLTQMLHRSVIL